MLAAVEFLLEFLLEVFLEGAVCGVLGALAEFLGTLLEKAGDAAEAVTDALESTAETATKTAVGVGILALLLVLGAGTGWIISELFPGKIFKSIPLTGISLLVTPLVVGGLMSLLGAWKAGNDQPSSFIATFFGGALFGFAAAGTRLLIIT